MGQSWEIEHIQNTAFEELMGDDETAKVRIVECGRKVGSRRTNMSTTCGVGAGGRDMLGKRI